MDRGVLQDNLSDRTVPPVFPFDVVRTEAHELTQGQRPPAGIISICAPTGYGKTVFAAGLLHHYQGEGMTCVWIGLQETDCDIERVLRIAEAALGGGAIADGDMRDVLYQGDAPLHDRIETILRQVSRLPQPLVLFIDNVNYCHDEGLLALLDALAFRTAPSVHLVVIGTGEPPLNIARAKIERGALEIGFEQLRLDHQGTCELLGSALCEQLSYEAIDSMVDLTEGWPAALRLLKIVLDAAEDPAAAVASFSGTDRDIAALLKRQVLTCFDRELCHFFIAIAQFGQFCGDLCRHAMDEPRAGEYMAHLLAQNPLLIPLDRHRQWFRLHGLLRDFLVSEAQRIFSEDERRQMLQRAAVWSENNGRWADAIEYALQSGSTDMAADILERVAAFYVRDQGDLQQYIRWTEALTDTGTRVGLEADFWYVWALVFYRRYDVAKQHVERLAARVREEGADHLEPPALAEFRQRIDIIRVAIDVYTDKLGGEAYDRAVAWLDQATDADPFDQATAAVAASLHAFAMHDLPRARQHQHVAQASIAQSDSAYGEAWVSVNSALIALGEGEYPSALQQLDGALSRAKSALGNNAGIVGTVASLAAKAAVEMNHADQARQLAEIGVRRLHTHGVGETAILGLDAGVKLWESDQGDWLTLDDLRGLAAVYPPRVATALSCLIVRRLLRLDRADDALLEARHIGLEARGRTGDTLAPGAEMPRTRSLLILTEAELCIAHGHFRHAETLIGAEHALARKQARWADVVDLALGDMSVALCSHNPEPASRHLTRAVTVAAKRRILRPFRERATQIAGLVNETKPQSWGFASEEERRFFGEICQDLPMVNSALLEQLEELECETTLLETPTARELELIKLVEAGLTNQQIADRVSVSVSTVKWHLYNLYTKLGVSSRSAALARARALNLLSR